MNEPQSTVLPYDFKLEPSWDDGLFEFSFRHNCHFQDKAGVVYISGSYCSIICEKDQKFPPQGTRWTLIAEDPIHIEPSIRCVNCGMHGFVREGRWLPA